MQITSELNIVNYIPICVCVKLCKHADPLQPRQPIFSRRGSCEGRGSTSTSSFAEPSHNYHPHFAPQFYSQFPPVRPVGTSF